MNCKHRKPQAEPKPQQQVPKCPCTPSAGFNIRQELAYVIDYPTSIVLETEQ
jgi:hypothetical protein